MNILIIGASSKTSLGWMIGQSLQNKDRVITYASRQGTLGLPCDITEPEDLDHVLTTTQPEIIIVGAGTFPDPQLLGHISSWEKIRDLVSAKTIGSLMAIDAAVRHQVRQVIFLAGSAVSNNPGFAPFTISNGAVWAAVQFATHHMPLQIYYLELGAVSDSSMGNATLMTTRPKEQNALQKKMATPQEVCTTIEKIIDGLYPSGSRVTVNHDGL